MPSNKDRLYVALYARGGATKMPGKEDTYHWGLVVGSKFEPEGATGVRFHAKETINTNGNMDWVFEERSCLLAPTSMLLIRVLVGKIEEKDRLVSILRDTPIRQGQPGWNCVAWVKEALDRLEADGKAIGTRVLEWQKVRDAAMTYCERKKTEHRFDGTRQWDTSKPPTYDLTQQKETIP